MSNLITLPVDVNDNFADSLLLAVNAPAPADEAYWLAFELACDGIPAEPNVEYTAAEAEAFRKGMEAGAEVWERMCQDEAAAMLAEAWDRRCPGDFEGIDHYEL